jgi:hypothetical protein
LGDSFNLPIFQFTNAASEQKAPSEPNHPFSLSKDCRVTAEVRVAERPIRVVVMRDVQRIEEVCGGAENTDVSNHSVSGPIPPSTSGLPVASGVLELFALMKRLDD